MTRDVSAAAAAWLRYPLHSEAGLLGLDLRRAFLWFYSERRVL